MEDRAAEALPPIERALTLEANRWDAYLLRGLVAGQNGDPSRDRVANAFATAGLMTALLGLILLVLGLVHRRRTAPTEPPGQ